MVVPGYDSEFVKTLRIFRNVVCVFTCAGFDLADFDPFIRRTLVEMIRFGYIDCGCRLIIQTLPFQCYGVVVPSRFNSGNIRLSDERNTVLFPKRMIRQLEPHVTADRRIDIDNR